MSRISMLAVCLTLLAGLAGCGKSASDANSDNKSNSVKSGTPAKSGNQQADNTPGGGQTGSEVSRPAVADAIDTTYISSNFVAAAVIHPRRIYDSKPVADFRKLLESTLGKAEVEKGLAELKKEAGFDPLTLEQAIALADMNAMTDFLPIGRRKPRYGGKSRMKTAYYPNEKTDDFRGEKKQSFPDDFKTEERRSFKTEAKTPAFPRGKKDDPDGCTVTAEFQPGGFPIGGPAEEEEPMPAFILRFSAPIDQKAFLDKQVSYQTELKRDGSKTVTKIPLKTEVVAGQTIHVREYGPAFAFADGGKTLLVGSPLNLGRMLDSKGADSPLIRRLKSISKDHDIIAAVAGQPVQQMLIEMRKQVPVDELPPEYQPIPDLIVGSKSLAVTFSISKDPMLSLYLETGEASSATNLAGLINKTGLPQLKAMYDFEKKKAAGEPEAQPFLKFGDELLAGLTVRSDKTDVVLELKRPASIGEAPALLVKAVQQAREAARRSMRKNNLKQIGLAFHNYHEIYSRFPSHDSNGEPKGQGRKEGLSWRVHLLPILDQGYLYRQFKLDEPWDSEHNKKLISRMPDVYASMTHPELQKEGKTMLHVFVGDSNPRPLTAFSMKGEKGEFIGPRIRDYLDGTSNTILVVEAGPDKADIWTKPGGLPFDLKKDPKATLGKIERGGFLALLCDGSVRYITAKISSESLKRLIQHQDGEPIGDDLDGGPSGRKTESKSDFPRKTESKKAP